MVDPLDEARRNQEALEQLRKLAVRQLRGEAAGHSLTPTALVNEALLRASSGSIASADLVNLKARAASLMRHILVDHARRKRRLKRGGGAQRVELPLDMHPSQPECTVDVLDLETALESLRQSSPRQHRIVELQFYGGLTQEEIAMHLGLSLSSVEKSWRAARERLRDLLSS